MSSSACIPDHIAQGQHQQNFARMQFLTNSSLSSLAARLPDHPPRCKRSRAGHESANGRLVYFTKSRRPQANWCCRCRADKFEPIDRVWIFISSNFSIVDSLAGSRTRRYHTAIVRRCSTFTHGGARHDYTRNVELLTDTYPPLRHQVLATYSEIRYMGNGRKIGPPRIPRLRTSSCHETLFSIVLR